MKDNLRSLFVLAGLVLGPASTQAIDHYVMSVLPDTGNGANALGADYEANAACGYTYDALGRTHACGWATLPSSVLHPLPELGGSNSQANACMDEEDFPFSIVGSAQNMAGRWKPCLWRETTPGAFSLQVLPTLGGTAGTINALYEDEPIEAIAFVGTTQTAGGNSHATLWRELSPGVFTAYDLGTLGGNNSEANDIVEGGTGGPDFIVVGRSQSPGGQWHACEWDVDYSSGITRIDRHPGGASSMFTGASMFHDGSGPMGCGNRMLANGRTRGFFDVFAELPLLLPTGGYQNLVTLDIAGHEMQHGFRAIGSAWDEPENPTAVILNVPDVTVIPNIYTIDQIAPAAAGLGVHLNASGQFIMVGSIIDSGYYAACLFLADGTELPDIVAVQKGNPAGQFDETNLWDLNNDGSFEDLRVKTQNGSGDSASIVTRFYGIEGTATSLHFELDMAAFGAANAVGQTSVEFWNFSSGQWDSAGPPVTVGSAIVHYEWDFNYAFHTPINPLTGEVRVRVNSSRVSGNVKGFQYSYAGIER